MIDKTGSTLFLVLNNSKHQEGMANFVELFPQIQEQFTHKTYVGVARKSLAALYHITNVGDKLPAMLSITTLLDINEPNPPFDMGSSLYINPALNSTREDKLANNCDNIIIFSDFDYGALSIEPGTMRWIAERNTILVTNNKPKAEHFLTPLNGTELFLNQTHIHNLKQIKILNWDQFRFLLQFQQYE